MKSRKIAAFICSAIMMVQSIPFFVSANEPEMRDICCQTRKTKKCDTQKKKKDHLRGEKIPLKWSLINL